MDWSRLPLSRAVVDRAANSRTDPELLPAALRDAGTQVVLVHEGRLATRAAGDRIDLDLRSVGEIRARTGAAERLATATHGGVVAEPPLWLFLGRSPGEPAYLAVVLPDELGAGVGLEGVPALDGLAELAAGCTWSTLRDVGHALGDRDTGLAALAVGLSAWHERHPRCPRCGGATDPRDGGWVRRCRVDGSDHYPRTDPAVIMAVVDEEDRILLGHAAHFPPRRFSTLAGYVEPGESLESAVRREVAEESGVVVDEVEYRGSQPWPFPGSLMLAFVARARSAPIVPDGAEITEAHWFTREELGRAVADGEVLLPMATSVARALIEDWFGGPLPTAPR